MDFLKIDGSYGEGGGQIVRSAVTLSSITKTPIIIENIRQNRKIPGLRPQHLTAIKILAQICDADVYGLNVGSKSIKFIPKNIENKKIEENIGTAGSITLILQVLIPAVAISKKSLKLSIIGGTDVPWSPTSNYTKYVLKEAYARMGINFSMEIKKRGYYPKGGGIIEVEVYPSEKLKPISLTKRQTNSVRLVCSYSDLSLDRITNEMQKAENILRDANLTVESEIKKEPALNEGASMLAYAYDSSSIIGSDGLTDTTADLAINISKNFTRSYLGADNHLSDMLVVPASLVNETSFYRIKEITKHLETNLYVSSKITGCKYGIGKLDDGFEVRISGNSNSTIQ
ncbi:MAG TPA: RNA 3'-terminal phosphate cyclase [Nitrosopumilaceae archaeon]|nr:RNA 3'-terminal phosphate cyclase [Nitrosopumilaceae archaeon]